MLSENAKDIPGYEGRYAVTSDGKVYSHSKIVKGKSGSERLVKGRWLKPGVNSRGYMTCHLAAQDGTSSSKSVHRLVAETFIDNPCNNGYVNHIDGNKLNNNVCNLEWVTSSENQLHAYKNKLKEPVSGERHTNSKLTKYDVVEIKRLDSIGIKRCEIAKIFNVDKSLISLILNGKAWRHENGRSVT
ncbi:endodeoxyribonuclease [Salmonella enterica]|nr:endodeoxyribonuclease [Salmonella enterica]EBR1113809.1 endodeoxyribonuclease [Salmonella enterica]